MPQSNQHPTGDSRRSFIKKTALGSALLASTNWTAFGQAGGSSGQKPITPSQPWYKTAYRWGQTNIVEIDPTRYDIDWWRSHWKRTKVQGVVLNAGGIVAYYPTKVPFHHKAEFLGDRDLLGELIKAAHDDGLFVFARMDSNRAYQDCYDAHPDWFAVDIDGKPYRRTEHYIACVNSPYYTEHIPKIIREVAINYGVEGFTDNNWNGPMRHQPCYCVHCKKSFREKYGHELPTKTDWNSQVYRDWIMWNYERRNEIWDFFNKTSKEAGGEHCVYIGMMAGSMNWQSRVFRDDREVYRKAEIVMLDDQRRHDNQGFMHNAEIGKRIHSVGGWDKIIPESQAMYHLTDHNFRLATKPVPEVRMWAVAGFAGGVQPWWHHVGAYQEDRRMFDTAEPLFKWHEQHQDSLINRLPLDTVGLVWSQRNTDFFGRDDAGSVCDDPWNGFGQAMVRARISYTPIHIDDIAEKTKGIKLLILPNIGAMSDAQIESIQLFVKNGGNLLATGQSSLFTEWGDVREDFGLAGLFGVNLPKEHPYRDEEQRSDWTHNWQHSYIRPLPELGARVNGPKAGNEPEITEERHTILKGFDQTDLLPYGGMLADMDVSPNATVPLTFVPTSPNTPAEAVWLTEPKTNIPALVLNEHANGSRVAYLPADIDRQFAKENIPDHGDLLANIVKWTVKNDLPFEVEGPGLIDCHIYHQPGKIIFHLVNLTSAGTWRTPVHELIALGPFKIRVRLTKDVKGKTIQSLVLGNKYKSKIKKGWTEFKIQPVKDHEVIVIS